MAQLSNVCRKVFFNPVPRNRLVCCARLVSTSGKKSEAGKLCETEQSVYKKMPDFANPNADNKNWISYGFLKENYSEDKFRLHFSYFMYISFLFCGSVFITMYFPDRGRRDWARREAFIRLHERETLGLDPIDANYIDPKLVVLPPDEDLCEEDIVI